MGWFQRLRGAVLPRDEPKEAPKAEIAVGAKPSNPEGSL